MSRTNYLVYSRQNLYSPFHSSFSGFKLGFLPSLRSNDTCGHNNIGLFCYLYCRVSLVALRYIYNSHQHRRGLVCFNFGYHIRGMGFLAPFHRLWALAHEKEGLEVGYGNFYFRPFDRLCNRTKSDSARYHNYCLSDLCQK